MAVKKKKTRVWCGDSYLSSRHLLISVVLVLAGQEYYHGFDVSLDHTEKYRAASMGLPCLREGVGDERSDLPRAGV